MLIPWQSTRDWQQLKLLFESRPISLPPFYCVRHAMNYGLSRMERWSHLKVYILWSWSPRLHIFILNAFSAELLTFQIELSLFSLPIFLIHDIHIYGLEFYFILLFGLFYCLQAHWVGYFWCVLVSLSRTFLLALISWKMSVTLLLTSPGFWCWFKDYSCWGLCCTSVCPHRLLDKQHEHGLCEIQS